MTKTAGKLFSTRTDEERDSSPLRSSEGKRKKRFVVLSDAPKGRVKYPTKEKNGYLRS
jgi:ssDNA-binding Zn-finger/Zn-ribbon topoisomerase 1